MLRLENILHLVQLPRPGCDKGYLEFEDYGSLPNGTTGARE